MHPTRWLSLELRIVGAGVAILHLGQSVCLSQLITMEWKDRIQAWVWQQSKPTSAFKKKKNLKICPQPLTSLSGVTCLLPGCMMKHKHIILNNLRTHIIGITEQPHFRIWTFGHASHELKYTVHTDILFRFGILLRGDSYYGPSLRDDTVLQDEQGFRGADLDSSTT